MATSHEDSNKTLTEIRSDLVCQICEKPGRKQWYRCLSLHLICQDCKEKNTKCSCGRFLSSEYCKVMEKLLGLATVGMKYNCVNLKNGCQEVLAETALEAHKSLVAEVNDMKPRVSSSRFKVAL